MDHFFPSDTEWRTFTLELDPSIGTFAEVLLYQSGFKDIEDWHSWAIWPSVVEVQDVSGLCMRYTIIQYKKS